MASAVRWSMVALFILLGARPAWAVFPPPVKDEGKFFGKAALDRANAKIRELYQKYQRDVVIETISTLTPDQEKKLAAEGKTKFFARLALDRANELGLHGVYVLICKKPQHLQVHMDPQTQKTAFRVGDRKALIDALVAQFKNDDFDAGLDAALKSIEQSLKANSSGK